MLIASKYPQGGIRLSDPHILAPLFSGGGAEYKIEDFEPVTGVRNQASEYNSRKAAIEMGKSNINAKMESGNATTQDIQQYAYYQQLEGELAAEKNALTTNTTTLENIPGHQNSNLHYVSDNFDYQIISENGQYEIQTWGNKAVNELNDIGYDDNGHFKIYEPPSLLTETSKGISDYIIDFIGKTKGSNKFGKATSNPTKDGSAQVSSNDVFFTTKYSATKAAELAFDEIINDKSYGLKEQLYSKTFDKLLQSYNKETKTFGIEKGVNYNVIDGFTSGEAVIGSIYLAKKKNGTMTNIVQYVEEQDGKRSYYQYVYGIGKDENGKEVKKITGKTKVNANDYSIMEEVAIDPSREVNLSTGEVIDKTYLNVALAFHMGLEAYNRDIAIDVLTKNNPNTDFNQYDDNNLKAMFKILGQETGLKYAKSYGTYLTQVEAQKQTVIEAQTGSSFIPSKNEGNNTGDDLKEYITNYKAMFLNSKSENIFLGHSINGKAYTMEDVAKFSNVRDERTITEHIWKIGYNDLKAFNNRDEARNLKGYGNVNLTEENPNLKVSQNFSNSNGVLMLSAFNGNNGMLTLSPIDFKNFQNNQIVGMSTEVFRTAAVNGLNFYLDTKYNKYLSPDIANSENRTNTAYKQALLKGTGQQVLDMNININRYTVGELLTTSDEKFSLNEQTSKWIYGTYQEINEQVKKEINVNTIFKEPKILGGYQDNLLKAFQEDYYPKIEKMLKEEGIVIRYDETDKKIKYTSDFDANGNPTISRQQLDEKIQTYTMQLISEDIIAQKGNFKWDDNEEVKQVRIGDLFSPKEIIRIFGYSDKNERGMYFIDRNARTGTADEEFIGEGYQMLKNSFRPDDIVVFNIGIEMPPTDMIPGNRSLAKWEQEYYDKEIYNIYNPNSPLNKGQQGVLTATTSK